MPLSRGRRLPERTIPLEWAGIRLLVWRNDVDPASEPGGVAERQLGARSRIDQDGMGHMRGLEVRGKGGEIGCLSFLLEKTCPVLERDSPLREKHLSRVDDPAHLDVDLSLAPEILAL